MEEQNEVPAAVEADEQDTSEEELVDTTDWKAEALKARRIASRLRGKLTKAQEAKVEVKQEAKPEQAKPEDNALTQKLEKMALKTAGITHPDDVELAQKTAKKWGMDIDEVVEDADFKVKLERQQTERANTQATSGVKGGAGEGQTKNSLEYWAGKGTPPTAKDVPDRAARLSIIRGMMKSGNSRGKFYNED